jgi:hypothetical protein
MPADLLQKMVGQLPQLSASERQRLRQALDFLGTKKVSATPSSTEDWLLPGIERELRRRGLSFAKLTPALVRRTAPNYVEDATAFCQYYGEKLRKAEPGLKHAHFLALGAVFARALADYLPQRLPPNVVVGAQTMLQNVSKLPDAIQASFPDYLASSGMVWVLIGRARPD